MVEKLTFGEILINLIIWLSMLVANRRQLYIVNSKQGIGYFLLFVLITAYSAFAFTTGDYFHYIELYNDAVQYHGSYHFEAFYNWLITVLPVNYNIWRLAVWGLAALFLILTFKRLQLNAQFASFIFVITLMFTFANLRNALGYIVLYYSASLLFYPSRHKYRSYLLGIIGIICSYFLHKSMFAYIILLGVSLLPFSKWVYILSLLLFPLLYRYVPVVASYVLSYGSETSQISGNMYLNSDFNQVANFNGLIQMFIHRFPILILLFIIIRSVYQRKEEIPFMYKVFVQYSYILIYISCLFYGQSLSAFFSSRFWNASLFPLTILFTFYFCYRPRTKAIKLSFYMLIAATLYDFAYSFYKL